MKTSYIVRGLDKDGNEAFYTGRAGDGWLSTNHAEAFDYASLEGAQNRGKNLNRMSTVHGWWFIGTEAR